MRAFAALALFVFLAPASYAEDWAAVHGKGVDAVKQRSFEAAADLLRQSLPLARTETQTAVSENDLGIVLCQWGHAGEGKIWLERALAVWKNDPARRAQYAQTAGALANAERTLGNYSAAEAELRAGIELPGVDGGIRSFLLSTLGDIMRETGSFAESRRLLREADSVPGVLWKQSLGVKVDLAELDRDTRNWEASAKEWNEAASLAREHGEAHAEADCARGLGQTWLDQGNVARAEPLLKSALAAFEGAPVRDEGELATALAAMGELYLAEGKSGLAEEALRRSLASQERALGAGHPQTALVLELLADAVARRSQIEMARGYLERAETIMSAQFGEHSIMAASVFVNRGALEQRAGNAAVAADQYRKALDTLGSGGPDLDSYRARLMTRYAEVLKASHHKREAAAVLAEAASYRPAK